MFKIILPVLLILFLSAATAPDDFYKWEDEEGNLHITDYPPPTKAAKKVKVHQTDSNADMSVQHTPQRTAPALPSAAPWPLLEPAA